jgi:hypothetical protein
MPAAFGPFSRGIQHVIDVNIKGIAAVYVDDITCFVVVSAAHASQEWVANFLTDVFGPDALSPKFQPVNTLVVTIGWSIDLVRGDVSPNEKGIRKLMVVFLPVDVSTNTRWTLRQCQVMASVAERYSKGILLMRPFVACLNRLTHHTRSTLKELRRPSAEARLAVMIWQAVASMLSVSPRALAVPLRTLLAPSSVPTLVGIPDAADAIGLRIFTFDNVEVMNTSYQLPF